VQEESLAETLAILPGERVNFGRRCRLRG